MKEQMKITISSSVIPGITQNGNLTAIKEGDCSVIPGITQNGNLTAIKEGDCYKFRKD